jgi:branched-chain amino acid transport system permease protein
LPRVDRHKAVIILALLLVAATPALGQPYLTRFATGVLIFGLVAMSLDLLVGYGGMVSFGHAAFFGLGAYATAVLGFHGIHSAFVAIPVAIGVAALAAFVIGGISLRTWCLLHHDHPRLCTDAFLHSARSCHLRRR